MIIVFCTDFAWVRSENSQCIKIDFSNVSIVAVGVNRPDKRALESQLTAAHAP